jgi:glucose-induced degradation protein 8
MQDERNTMLTRRSAQILDSNPQLHFQLLQLSLIEIIRNTLSKQSSQSVAAGDFRSALEFATQQLAPRAPTDARYREALERTMALMVYPVERMLPQFKELLDFKLREKVATDVNKAMLEARGERPEAKIRRLVRARAWAENSARGVMPEIPNYIPIGLDAADETGGAGRAPHGDAMVA